MARADLAPQDAPTAAAGSRVESPLSAAAYEPVVIEAMKLFRPTPLLVRGTAEAIMALSPETAAIEELAEEVRRFPGGIVLESYVSASELRHIVLGQCLAGNADASVLATASVFLVLQQALVAGHIWAVWDEGPQCWSVQMDLPASVANELTTAIDALVAIVRTGRTFPPDLDVRIRRFVQKFADAEAIKIAGQLDCAGDSGGGVAGTGDGPPAAPERRL